MTTLPERLRASAQSLRASVKTSAPAVLVHPHTFHRIARELEEAAQALEAQREDRREVLRILYEAHRKTNPSPSLAAISAAIQHLQAVEDAPSAQVAQEGAAGVAPAGALPDPKLCPRCCQYHGPVCPAGVAMNGGKHG